MTGSSTPILHPGAAAVGHYVHWGVIQISAANLVIILVMIAVFVLALVVPFPGSRSETRRDQEDSDDRH